MSKPLPASFSLTASTPTLQFHEPITICCSFWGHSTTTDSYMSKWIPALSSLTASTNIQPLPPCTNQHSLLQLLLNHSLSHSTFAALSEAVQQLLTAICLSHSLLHSSLTDLTSTQPLNEHFNIAATLLFLMPFNNYWFMSGPLPAPFSTHYVNTLSHSVNHSTFATLSEAIQQLVIHVWAIPYIIHQSLLQPPQSHSLYHSPLILSHFLYQAPFFASTTTKPLPVSFTTHWYNHY